MVTGIKYYIFSESILKDNIIVNAENKKQRVVNIHELYKEMRCDLYLRLNEARETEFFTNVGIFSQIIGAWCIIDWFRVWVKRREDGTK